MGTKEGKHSNSESAALFRGAVGDAKPLNSRERHMPDNAPKSKPGSKARLNRRDRHLPPEETTSTPKEAPETSLAENMSFQRSGITRKIMRELRRGKYLIQEEIDLHGCTRPEARAALEAFINDCAQQGLSCIRVIHGKGMRSGPEGPVLKFAVNHWLQEWDVVQAFCPAQNSDGGTGAVYVLLRNT